MIQSWGEPTLKESGIWELPIKVLGEKGVYTQIVTFETLKSAQEYIKYMQLAIEQRNKGVVR